MRSVYSCLIFLLIPGLSYGVIVDAPDVLGVYFDQNADMVSIDVSAFSAVEAYLILAHPTQTTIHGFEAGVEFTGPYAALSTSFPVGALNHGSAENLIVDFDTPMVTTEVTLLATLNFYYTGSGEGLFIELGGSSPSSLSGDFPVIIGDADNVYECNYLGFGMGVNVDGGFPNVVYAPDSSSFVLPVAENFDDGIADGFEAVSGVWSVQDGAYFGLNDAPGTRAISSIGDEGWWNYRTSVDVLVDGAPYHEVLVRYHDSQTGYAVSYSCEPEPTCTLRKILFGEEEMLVQEAAPALACGQWHTLTVDVIGGEIRALMDGHLLFNFRDTDNPLISGKVALVSSPGTHSYSNAGFDNLTIVPIQGANRGTLSPVPEDLGSINCYSPQGVSFLYEPDDDDPAIRGYSVSFRVSDNVICDPALFEVHSLPSGEVSFYEVIENGPNDFTIDYTVAGADPTGISGTNELFTIFLEGDVEGAGTVEIYSVDFRDLDNQNISVYFYSAAEFLVDCSTPVVVEGCTATPGPGFVHLAWEEPANPDNFSTLIYRAMYSVDAGVSAYPYYGQAENAYVPERPVDLAAAFASVDWVPVATVPAHTLAYGDTVSERGIYYYEFFSVDPAGGISPPLSNQVVATSYRLGDVMAPYDGLVNGADLSFLGSSYALYAEEAGFLAEADVGPATGGSGTGLPLPDGYVGFDDMMIFGLNYGEPVGEKNTSGGLGPVRLSWERDGEGRLECRLLSGSSGLKGLRYQLDSPSCRGWECRAGSLLEEQGETVFFNVDRKRGLDISMVSLGAGMVIDGTGPLFSCGVESGITPGAGQWTARDRDNQPIEVVVEISGESLVPREAGLFQNVPNPFNPSTVISFEIPMDQTVSLGIYGLDGKLVREFGAQYYGAGRHEIAWDGTDGSGRRMASGTYFCRMKCDGFDHIIKMALTK